MPQILLAILECVAIFFFDYCFIHPIGQDKKWNENHANKITKIPKTNRRKYGMNETEITK